MGFTLRINSFLDELVVASDIEIFEETATHIKCKIFTYYASDLRDLPFSKAELLKIYQNYQKFISVRNDFQRTIFSFRLPTFEWWRSPLPKLKYLSDISPKDKPWDSHRAASDLVTALYESAEFTRYAERIKGCSQLLEFEKVLKDNQLVYKLRSAHFCRHRHCIICQWRRTLMWIARFSKALPKIQKDYPKHRYIFLTLTVRNCALEELRDTITWMNKSFVRLSQRKAFPADGYIKSLEVTRNKKDNTAHPHFHVLLMVPKSYFSGSGGYLSKDKWIKIWRSCLRVNYDPSIDVQAVNPKKGEEGLVDVLREVFKYQVKTGDLVYDKEWLIELTKQLHKTRAIGLGGVFKKYLSEKEPEDYISEDVDNKDDILTDERFRAGWLPIDKRYIIRDSDE